MNQETSTELIKELVDALQGLLIVQAGISADTKAAQNAAKNAMQKAREAIND